MQLPWPLRQPLSLGVEEGEPRRGEAPPACSSQNRAQWKMELTPVGAAAPHRTRLLRSLAPQTVTDNSCPPQPRGTPRHGRAGLCPGRSLCLQS